MNKRCSIYFLELPVVGINWRVQVGYDVLGTYKTRKGARIAAKKLGYNY